jgi:hypothetical protein
VIEFMDSMLISLYEISGNPVGDYLIGTFLLALLCVVVGRATMAMVFRVNRKHLEKLDNSLIKLNRLSGQALELGDEKSYKACNKEANDSFGHLFFGKFGLSAASFWPAFFALAWMQERFLDIEIPIPGTGLGMGYFLTFLICYAVAWVSLGRIMRRAA